MYIFVCVLTFTIIKSKYCDWLLWGEKRRDKSFPQVLKIRNYVHSIQDGVSIGGINLGGSPSLLITRDPKPIIGCDTSWRFSEFQCGDKIQAVEGEQIVKDPNSILNLIDPDEILNLISREFLSLRNCNLISYLIFDGLDFEMDNSQWIQDKKSHTNFQWLLGIIEFHVKNHINHIGIYDEINKFSVQYSQDKKLALDIKNINRFGKIISNDFPKLNSIWAPILEKVSNLDDSKGDIKTLHNHIVNNAKFFESYLILSYVYYNRQFIKSTFSSKNVREFLTEPYLKLEQTINGFYDSTNKTLDGSIESRKFTALRISNFMSYGPIIISKLNYLLLQCYLEKIVAAKLPF